MIKAKHPNDMTADELRAASDALSRNIDAMLADCSRKIARLQAERAEALAALKQMVAIARAKARP